MPRWGLSQCSGHGNGGLAGMGNSILDGGHLSSEGQGEVSRVGSLCTACSQPTNLSVSQAGEQLQQVPWRPPFCTVLSLAGIGLSSPPKGTRGWRPPLSDETPAQGSLSLMKGSLCSTGRPLAKDKTAVCPLSLVWGWGPPLMLADGWGWYRCTLGSLSFLVFQLSLPLPQTPYPPTVTLPLSADPQARSSLVAVWKTLSFWALEASKQMKE